MQKQTEQMDKLNFDNQINLCGTTNAPFLFQRVTTNAPMSEVTRSVVHENVIQFKAHNKTQEQPEQEGITALYERLSNEDKLEGESNSIANQKKIMERYCKEHGYIPFRHYDEEMITTRLIQFNYSLPDFVLGCV